MKHPLNLLLIDDVVKSAPSLAYPLLRYANSPVYGLAERVSSIRARFCEQTANLFGLQPTEQYLLGLFSLLPAMLQKTMAEALAEILLREPLLEALPWQRNVHWRPLEWFEAHERAHSMSPMT